MGRGRRVPTWPSAARRRRRSRPGRRRGARRSTPWRRASCALRRGRPSCPRWASRGRRGRCARLKRLVVRAAAAVAAAALAAQAGCADELRRVSAVCRRQGQTHARAGRDQGRGRWELACECAGAHARGRAHTRARKTDRHSCFDGVRAVLFDFEARVPLGLDLTEVRISQENGGPRVAIKGIKPEGQVRSHALAPAAASPAPVPLPPPSNWHGAGARARTRALARTPVSTSLCMCICTRARVRASGGVRMRACARVLPWAF